MIVSVVHGLQLVEDEEIGRWYSELIMPEKSAAADGEFAGCYMLSPILRWVDSNG